MSSIAVWIDSSVPRRRTPRIRVRTRGSPGIDHLADIIVKLNQIDEDGPLNFQEKVLLVLLKFRMEPIDHALARGLGTKLTLERRLQQV